MTFRSLPWKRNVAKVPKKILQDLHDIQTDLVIIAVTKTITAADLSAYQHLSIPTTVGETIETTPLKEMGKYSTRNQAGWEQKRDDLPKVLKTYYWESPNWGGNGTHTSYKEREVFLKEFHEPRMFNLEVELIRVGEGIGSSDAYRFAIGEPLDRTRETFDQDLLFALNILQENVGATGVFASDATRAAYLKTIHLDWQIFPPENRDELVRAFVGKKVLTREEEDKVSDRIDLFSRLKPQAYLQGTGGLSSYIGAQFADDLVVFENMKYGNALYFLYDDWQDISQRSRLELVKGTFERYDRVIHKPGWKAIVRKILQRERLKRRVK